MRGLLAARESTWKRPRQFLLTIEETIRNGIGLRRLTDTEMKEITEESMDGSCQQQGMMK